MEDVHHVQLSKNQHLLLQLKVNVEEFVKKLYAQQVKLFFKKDNANHVHHGPNHWVTKESVDQKFVIRERN